jgi:hypothetical protein
VLLRERLAFVLGDDPGLAVRDVLDREVGRVAAVRMRHHVLAEGLDFLKQRVHRHPGKARAELRPLGDAVDVAGNRLLWKRAELLRAPSLLLRDHPVDP